MASLLSAVQLLFLCPLLVLGSLNELDRFSIFEQINPHQAYIDQNLTCDNANLYAFLYWPEGAFRVIGMYTTISSLVSVHTSANSKILDSNRDATVGDHKDIRGIYDYAH
jgi:hypothetical protein